MLLEEGLPTGPGIGAVHPVGTNRARKCRELVGHDPQVECPGEEIGQMRGAEDGSLLGPVAPD